MLVITRNCSLLLLRKNASFVLLVIFQRLEIMRATPVVDRLRLVLRLARTERPQNAILEKVHWMVSAVHAHQAHTALTERNASPVPALLPWAPLRAQL